MRQYMLIGLGIVLGISLLAGIFLVPVDNVLRHSHKITVNDDAYGNDNDNNLSDRFWGIISYHNLSDRGKELYRETLAAGGTYTVPKGEGAPEFPYPTKQDIRTHDGSPVKFVTIIIRPANDSGLPPAPRYLGFGTRSVKPPLTGAPWMLRYLAGFVGVVLLAGSGYALYRKRSAGLEHGSS